MNKILLSAVSIVLLAFGSARACDLCGCGISNGVYPSDEYSLFGIYYGYGHFAGWHSENAGEQPQYFSEYYHRFELRLKYALDARLELMANLPYAVFQQYQGDTRLENIAGMGNISLMARYAIINDISDENHRLSVGAGIELATGANAVPSSNGQLKYNYQPATGSTNLILNASYGYKSSDGIGAVTSVSYTMYGQNADGYRRGNAFAADVEAFYQTHLGRTKLVPKIIAGYERNGRNQVNGEDYTFNTERQFALAGVGLDVYLTDMFLSASYRMPVWQTLETNQMENLGRLSVGVSYILR